MPSTWEGRLLPMGESVRSVSPAATLGANEASLYDGAITRPLLADGSGDGHSDMIDVDGFRVDEDTNTGILLAEGASDREIDNLVVGGSQQDYDNLVWVKTSPSTNSLLTALGGTFPLL